MTLSREIIIFAGEREKDENDFIPIPGKENTNQDTIKMLNYSAETVALYNERFAARVKAIHDELATNHLIDETLEYSYLGVVNRLQMESIAESIGSLAEKLPQINKESYTSKN